MAFDGNPSTATTVEELVRTEAIEPMIGAASKEKMKIAKYAREISLIGRGSKTASVVKEVADFSEADVANYDIAGETTAVVNASFNTVAVQISSAEYGIGRPVTDTAIEDNILGMDLWQYIVESGSEDLALCADDDMCALLTGFSVVVGTTTAALTLANMAQAVIQLRAGNLPADGGAVFALGTNQASNYDSALVASTTTQLANYYTKSEADNGLGTGTHGTWMNCPVLSTSLVDTANTGADEAGGLFLRGDEGRNMRSAAIVKVLSRDVRVGYDRDELNRKSTAVITQRLGFGEAHDLAGVAIQTDAG